MTVGKKVIHDTVKLKLITARDKYIYIMQFIGKQ